MKQKYLFFALVLTLLLSLASCGVPSAPSATTPDVPSWQEQYDLGLRLLFEGNYEAAVLAFTAAIEIDPKQAPAYVGRGDAYIGNGETAEILTLAQADYEAALELDNQLAAAWLGLVDAYIRQGDFDKALELAKEGLEMTGDQSLQAKIDELESGTVNDASGKIRKITAYDGDSNLVWYHLYDYSIEGIDYRISAHDATGIETSSVDCVEMDGYRISCSYSFGSGELTQRTTTLNETGKDIETIFFEGGNEHRSAYTYNSAGQKYEEAIYVNGVLIGKMVWDSYGVNGEWTHMSFYDADGGILSSQRKEYGEDGKPVYYGMYESDGSLSEYMTYEYDEYGNQTKVLNYNALGELTQILESGRSE